MWLFVTAKIDDKETRKMRFNSDNVISYGPGKGSPSVVFALDGQAYPVMESPEQLDKILMGNVTDLIFKPVPPPTRKRR